jgi:rare lipoprotein A
LIKSLYIIAFCFSFIIASAQQNVCTASYYAQKFDGRKTACGEIFDNNKLTCAHKSLPFGTKIKVICLNTNKSVIVRVNDRGPFIKGRDLDLSYRAAKELGFVQNGFAKVQYEILNGKPIHHSSEDTMNINSKIETTDTFLQTYRNQVDTNSYTLKLATVSNVVDLLSHLNFLSSQYGDKIIVADIKINESIFYNILLHKFHSFSEADLSLNTLRIQFPDSYILHPSMN